MGQDKSEKKSEKQGLSQEKLKEKEGAKSRKVGRESMRQGQEKLIVKRRGKK